MDSLSKKTGNGRSLRAHSIVVANPLFWPQFENQFRHNLMTNSEFEASRDGISSEIPPSAETTTSLLRIKRGV
jgi:hypothetical protein